MIESSGMPSGLDADSLAWYSLTMALEASGLHGLKVVHWPWLLSDNGAS